MPPNPESESKETISRFEKLLAELARGGVDFAVVGGLAVILNGYPRVTLDAGIIVHEAPDNLQRMIGCLSGWGEGWARELTSGDFPAQEGSLRIMEEFDLDVFTRMQGKSLEDFRPRLRHIQSDDVRIPFIAPVDLVSLKQGSWREKDQLDVAAMKAIIAREARAGQSPS